ncbi:MAG: adenosylmethionine decarboxylase [Hyphomicrobiaceae bacterium]
MDLEASTTRTEESVWTPGIAANDDRLDHFIERDGVRFAGTHLIIDLFGARRLDEIGHIEEALKRCVDVAGATLLHIHLHHFTPNGGVSGVAVLAESHISIHSWPEAGYAALDVFMCGKANPHLAIGVLQDAFGPERIEVKEHLRGDKLEDGEWSVGSTKPSIRAGVSG